MSIEYLFGYGSLINHESRKQTGVTHNPVPIHVVGFERSWCVPAPAMNLTGLGLYQKQGAACNGVLVEVSPDQIAEFDERELGGSDANYDRIEIDQENIIGIPRSVRSAVWAYTVRNPVPPTTAFPIAQSYLDIILSGCLQFGEQFAIDFTKSTTGWNQPWINDRTRPRYIRHMDISSDILSQIDGLLTRILPEMVKTRITVQS